MHRLSLRLLRSKQQLLYLRDALLLLKFMPLKRQKMAWLPVSARDLLYKHAWP